MRHTELSRCYFCIPSRLFGATIHSSLRQRAKWTLSYSASWATSTSSWRIIRKVSHLFTCTQVGYTLFVFFLPLFWSNKWFLFQLSCLLSTFHIFKHSSYCSSKNKPLQLAAWSFPLVNLCLHLLTALSAYQRYYSLQSDYWKVRHAGLHVHFPLLFVIFSPSFTLTLTHTHTHISHTYTGSTFGLSWVRCWRKMRFQVSCQSFSLFPAKLTIGGEPKF